VILWLGRSSYLVRVMDLPEATPEERRSMARLQIEATLPADFGPIEVSLRPLSAPGRFEAVFARRRRVEAAVAAAERDGWRVTRVWPTTRLYAAWWSGRFEAGDLLVLREAEGSAEVAYARRDGAIRVRWMETTDAASIGDRLAETVRSVLAEQALRSSTLPEKAPPVCDWLGPPLADRRSNGWTVRRLPEPSLVERDPTDTPWRSILRLVRLVADGLAEDSAAATSDLMPATRRSSAARGRNLRGLAVGVGLYAATAGLVAAALQIGAHRWERRLETVDRQVGRIASEGRAVGQRLERLQLVEQARGTRADFGRVLTALHEAADEGLSYRRVELGEDRRLSLRGQADAVSMPFELPARLEAQPGLTGVVLRDAGQTQKGQGSIAEFRLEAQVTPPAGERGGS
jgi:hypothetical protein